MAERPLLATGLAAGTNDSLSNRRAAISWPNLVDAFRLNLLTVNLFLLSAGLTDDGEWKESRYLCKGKTFFDISFLTTASFLILRPWTNACFSHF